MEGRSHPAHSNGRDFSHSANSGNVGQLGFDSSNETRSKAGVEILHCLDNSGTSWGRPPSEGAVDIWAGFHQGNVPTNRADRSHFSKGWLSSRFAHDERDIAAERFDRTTLRMIHADAQGVPFVGKTADDFMSAFAELSGEHRSFGTITVDKKNPHGPTMPSPIACGT